MTSLDAGGGSMDRQMRSEVVREVLYIPSDDPRYPVSLKTHLADKASASIAVFGDITILQNKSLAVFCSSKCPGSIIIKTYDLMKQLREKGVTVIGGFHSAIERECLNILLKGRQSIIYCPARGIERMKIRPEIRKPLEDGRLLMLSPFGDKQRRISADLADTRNDFIAALAQAIFVSYAAPGSKTERFCARLMTRNKVVYMLQDERNGNPIVSGARSVTEIADLQLSEAGLTEASKRARIKTLKL